MKSRHAKWAISVLLSLAAWSLCAALDADPIADGFASPPTTAQPRVWWHWLNGNISKEGITADLEAMQRVGLAGAIISNVNCSIPAGPVTILSDSWWEMMGHAEREAKRLNLDLGTFNCPGWSSSGGPWITPEYGMQRVVSSEQTVQGPAAFSAALPQPETKLGFYRDIAVLAFPTPPAEAAKIDDLPHKADLLRGEHFAPAKVPAQAAGAIAPDRVLDLTSRMMPDGKLSWDVPAGTWTVVRFGYTPTGAVNAPAPDQGQGLECDKLSRAAAEKAWAGMMAPIVQRAGGLAGQDRTLKTVVIDSYERGSQNWTAGFEKEFRQRRGYDLLPYLPTLTGRAVGSAEISDRFLHDFRLTIADMFSENYYDTFATMAHRSGLQLQVEPYGNGPFSDLRAAKESDLVMGEFWQGGGAISSLRLASSIAHTYGKQLVGAESLTGPNGDWSDSPAMLKRWGDAAFAMGINLFYLHSYVHQPWMNLAPGVTLGKYGTNFGRNNTWWNQAGPWVRYLARCQYLLQQGRYVADVLYFCGEEAPVGAGSMTPPLPAGYASDACNADVLLHRLAVKDGRLTLPDGMSYRILVLPPQTAMTPAVLKKLAELADAGATIVGPKPLQSPSLSDYPQCDREVAQMADALWSSGKIKTAAALAPGVPPDFQSGAPPSAILYLHRTAGNKEIYFVANQGEVARQLEAAFRVAGKAPELWHPDTGERETVPLYTEENGVTRLPLHLDPTGSVFVVFDKKSAADHPVSLTRTGPPDASAPEPVLEINHASYEAIDHFGAGDVTARVAALVKKGGLVLKVDSTTLGGDPTPMHQKQLRVDYVLDGKEGHQTVTEGSMLEIVPDIAGGFPDARLGTRDDGALRLTAWRSGAYEVKTIAGKTYDVVVENLPAPFEVTGPWALSFPTPGVPPLTLDKLASWSDQAEPKVKYYSGTALYEKTFSLSSGLRGENRRLFLDLGDVQVLAEVKLNGKDLGILWKKPFRVEVTGAAQEGENRLEVRVTNLWPNRLIGDAQLPDDCEWDGDHLKKWPDWLLQGKPSPTGRATFATWKHWNKDDALLPSGLLGPVTLHPALDRSVP